MTGGLREDLETLHEHADVLLVAGDLTGHGTVEEASALAREIEDLEIPIVAVLGNHDYHSDQQDDIRTLMEGAGVRVLEGESTTVTLRGTTLGVAGVKGFSGGFVGAAWGEFGEPQMRALIRHTRESAERLQASLEDLTTDKRVALLHYSPIEAAPTACSRSAPARP